MAICMGFDLQRQPTERGQRTTVLRLGTTMLGFHGVWEPMIHLARALQAMLGHRVQRVKHQKARMPASKLRGRMQGLRILLTS